MESWHAIVLGLVEGITEYLPISSTGHLIIASSLLGLDGGSTKAAADDFEIVIQGGAILAVVGLYWPRFVQMLRGVLGKDPAGFRLLVNLFIAFLPAAMVGLIVHHWIKEHLFRPVPVVAALVIGGVYMIGVEAWRKGRFSPPVPAARERGLEDLSPLHALVIGVLQCFSLFPGTSRSMMTITGGLFCRLRPAAAAEFSFLLGVPTLLAATGLALFKNLKESHHDHTPNLIQTLGVVPVLLGVVVAAISAALAVRWLVGFLNRRGLAPFGFYRILLGICLTGLILGQVVRMQPERVDTRKPAPAALPKP